MGNTLKQQLKRFTALFIASLMAIPQNPIASSLGTGPIMALASGGIELTIENEQSPYAIDRATDGYVSIEASAVLDPSLGVSSADDIDVSWLSSDTSKIITLNEDKSFNSGTNTLTVSAAVVGVEATSSNVGVTINVEAGTGSGSKTIQVSATGERPDANSIAVDPDEYSLTLDDLADNPSLTILLSATVSPEIYPVTWESSNPSVATVADGEVTPRSLGTTNITATAGTKSATCVFTVGKHAAPAAPTLSYTVSGTVDSPVFTISTGTTGTYEWSKSSDFSENVSTINSSTFTVSETGVYFVGKKETADTEAGEAASITVASPVTLTFNKNTDDEVSNLPAPKPYKAGSVSQTVAAPSRTGYGFGGWYKEPGCINPFTLGTSTVTSNMTIYAKWTGLTGEVELSGTGATSFALGTSITASLTTDLTSSDTGALTYTWKYVDPLTSQTGETVATTATLSLNNNAYIGESFVCEVTAASLSGTVTSEIVGPVTKGANTTVLDPDDFATTNAIVHINGGITLGTISFPDGAEYEYKKTSSSTYLATAYDSVHGVTEDLSVVAGRYHVRLKETDTAEASDPITITIKYNYEVMFNFMGRGEDEITSAAAEETVSPSHAPSATGYSFGGWFTDEELTESWNIATDTVYQPMTLYAKWVATEYGITYNLSGGEMDFGFDNRTTYTVEDSFTLYNPHKAYYTFKGWKRTGEDDSAANISTRIPRGTTGNLSFVAVFEATTLSGRMLVEYDRTNPLNTIEFEKTNFVYGQTIKATITECNETGSLTYKWYRSGSPDVLVGTGQTYTIQAADIDKYLYCEITSSNYTGAVRSDRTPIILPRPALLTGTIYAEERAYIAGDRTATIEITGSEQFVTGSIKSTDSISLKPKTITGTLDDEYVGTNKSVTITASDIELATSSDSAKYAIDLSSTRFKGTVTAAELSAGTKTLYASTSSTITSDLLAGILPNANGRDLTFSISSGSLSGTTIATNTSTRSFMAPVSPETVSIRVSTASKDMNRDEVPEYTALADAGTITLIVNNNTPQSIAFENTGISGDHGDTVSLSKDDVPFAKTAVNETVASNNGFVYSSNNTSVAEVNSSTGEITIKREGKTIISAFVDAPDSTYNPGIAQYTLTVTPTEILASAMPVINNPVYDGTSKEGVTRPTGVTSYEVLTSSFGNTNIGEYTTEVRPVGGYVWPLGTFYEGTDNEITINTSNRAYSLILSWSVLPMPNENDPANLHIKVTPSVASEVNGKIEIREASSSDIYYDSGFAYSALEMTTISEDASDNEWATITDSDMLSGLAAGTYYLRYKANGNTAASSVREVVILPAYVVTFVNSEGAAPETQYVAKNSIVSRPNDPTATDYTFSGWFVSLDAEEPWDFIRDKVTADTILYAGWEAKRTTINYIYGGGTPATPNKAYYTKEMSQFTLVNPVLSGFAFKGWTATGGMTITQPQLSVTVNPQALDGLTAITFSANYNTRVAKPAATPGTGAFTTPTNTITLSVSGASDAVIYYTLDGSEPTTSSSVYDEPIVINATTTLKAFAIKPASDLSPSEVATFTYTKKDPPPVPITGFKIDQSRINMLVGKTAQLTGIPLPEDTTETGTITYTSDNPLVATVDETGLITGVKVGRTNVKVQLKAKAGTFLLECTVNVKEAPITGISVSTEEVIVEANKTSTVTATILPEERSEEGTVVWSSEDEEIATVDENGVITGVSAGTTEVNASVTGQKGTFKKSIDVEVTAEVIEVTEIFIVPETAKIAIGKTKDLAVAFAPENENEDPDIMWSSSNTEVATVEDGVVTAVAAGEVTITATSAGVHRDVKATCTVTVVEHLTPVESISVTPETATINIGETVTLTATVLPEEADDKTVIWSSSDSTIASISQEGVVTSISAGDAIMTATSSDEEIKATATITVIDPNAPIPDPPEPVDETLDIIKDTDGGKNLETVINNVIVEKTESDGTITTETKIWVGGLNSAYPYTGSAIKPDFRVYDGLNTLTPKTDYTVSYKDNVNVGEASIIIKFKGNYSTMKNNVVPFNIVNAVFGESILALDQSLTVKKDGKEQAFPKPQFLKADGKVGTINANGYKVTYKDPSGESVSKASDPGVYTATVTGKTSYGYAGSTSFTVTVVESDKNLSKAKIKFEKGCNTKIYTGKDITFDSGDFEVMLSGDTVSPSAYEIVYIDNNKDVGKHTFMVKAKENSGYAGFVKGTFTIKGGKDYGHFNVRFAEGTNPSIEYSKNASAMRPHVLITDLDSGENLVLNKDFTVKYVDANEVGLATAEITGKGRYSKDFTRSLNFTITEKEIGNTMIEARCTNEKDWEKVSVKITDNGKTLSKKDYEVDSVSESSGGQVIVSISGYDNYKGSAQLLIPKYSKKYDIGKAKVSKIEKEYTGSPVTLTNTEIADALTLNGDNLLPNNFRVVGYTNNTKKGTAKVVVAGIAPHCGQKTLTFKIVQKSSAWGSAGKALVNGTWIK